MGSVFKRKRKVKQSLIFRYSLIFVLTFYVNGLKSQNRIDAQQIRIDTLDGVKDDAIKIEDSKHEQSANNLYFVIIDSIQNILQQNDSISAENRIIIKNGIYQFLRKTKQKSFFYVKRNEKSHVFLLKWLKNYKSNNSLSLLENNKKQSFGILNYIYGFNETEAFLKRQTSNNIDLMLLAFKDIDKADYANSLLEKNVLLAPTSAKKYFSKNQKIHKVLSDSKNPEITKILEINTKYRRNTKAYVLLDKIVNNEITIEEAHEIGKSAQYFNYLLEIRKNKKPLAEISLDRELNYETLEYIRAVNHLHNESNSKLRFASIKNLNAEKLYTIMVYGEEEIFTSSFNGVYDVFQQKLKEEGLSGYALFEKVGFNRFRVFIKMLSYYGWLNSFLNTMTNEEKELTLRAFVGEIQNSNDRIKEAVNIADAISAIEDSAILLLFEEEMYRINNSKELDKDTRLIYGLLIKIFNPKTQVYKNFFDSIANSYVSPPIERIEQVALLGNDSINVQKHFFYDDDDGKASFWSFLSSFKNSNWKISYNEEYIVIQSTNKRVKIYANKPKYEKIAWQKIDEVIRNNKEDVEFVIHRGHSYYVDYTIKEIPKTTQLILLGSCGGYNKLSALLEKSDNAHIISTKQIGSMGVNNPLIYKMAERIRKGKTLDWKEYWDSLKTYFKGKGKTEERFYDYVPPHQNLGAKFIKAYKLQK